MHGRPPLELTAVQALQIEEIADRHGPAKALRVRQHADRAAREAFDSCLGALYDAYIVDDGAEVNGKPFTAGPTVEPVRCHLGDTITLNLSYDAPNVTAGSYGK
jgi:hypothetical protein